jgi:hypothetical protein
MTECNEAGGQLDIARLAASARERGVPPESFIVQVKESVYRARDRPRGHELDELMATIVCRAIAEYYGVVR